MKKKVILLFLLVFLVVPFMSCKKTENKVFVDTTVYEIGKKVSLSSKTAIVFQDVQFSKDFKLQTTTEGVQNFPFVYLKKDKTGPRIIRIEKDGSTIDTIIDTVTSKSYSSAYIVEIGGDLKKTIARYVLDTEKNVIKPKLPSDQFIFISLLYANDTRKPILTKDLSLFIELTNQSKIQFDTILAETILSNSIPKEIKPSESSSLRYIGVVPLDVKEIYINFEGKKFKWEIKDIKKTN